jgi:Domain of unknown function (DUF4111)
VRDALQIVDDYLTELARRMQEILGQELLAVYAAGSYALGAYEHGRSDIDVTAVVAGPLPDNTKQALVATLRHEALPCPARGLELVIYPRATVEHPIAEPGFELNLNTGERMGFRADFEPGDIEGFWFAIDRSILREHAIPVRGPEPTELFAPIPRDTLLGLLAESVRWHRDSDVPLGSDVVLNSARSLHFVEHDTWVSKPAAAAWFLATVENRLDQAQGAP